MALQSSIQSEMGLNNVQFNMLYSVYSAPNIVLPLFGGILVDKFGVRVMIFSLTTILIIGQSIIVIGGYTLSYATLLAGRCFYGTGSESLNAAQASIINRWFPANKVSLALGLCLSFPKLGSAMNSLMSPMIQANRGELGFTFLVGLFFLLFSWCCGLLLIYLDKRNEKQMNIWEQHNQPITQELSLQLFDTDIKSSNSDSDLQEDEEMKVSDIKNLDFSYWILACIIMLSEGLFLTFLDNGNAFLQAKFGFTQESAGVLLTIPYVFSACVTPFFGICTDRVKQRSILIILATVVFLVTHLCLLFIHCDTACGITALPLLSLGICYACYSAILIPSVTLVVKHNMIGTAFGILGVLQNIALTVFPIITGSIFNANNINNLGEYDAFQGYVHQSYFFVCIAVVNFFAAICLYIFDKKGNKKLSQ